VRSLFPGLAPSPRPSRRGPVSVFGLLSDGRPRPSPPFASGLHRFEASAGLAVAFAEPPSALISHLRSIVGNLCLSSGAAFAGLLADLRAPPEAFAGSTCKQSQPPGGLVNECDFLVFADTFARVGVGKSPNSSPLRGIGPVLAAHDPRTPSLLV
jgi:hypothetical protein